MATARRRAPFVTVNPIVTAAPVAAPAPSTEGPIMSEELQAAVEETAQQPAVPEELTIEKIVLEPEVQEPKIEVETQAPVEEVKVEEIPPTEPEVQVEKAIDLSPYTQGLKLDDVATNAIEQVVARKDFSATVLLSQILDYARKMSRSGGLNPERAAQEQAALYRTLVNLIRLENGDSYRRLINLTVYLFKILGRSGDVFCDTMVMRYTENVPLGHGDLRAWGNLINLLRLCADESDRAVRRRSFSIDRALAHFTDADRARLNTALM
jgi:hypothetical protein